MGSTYTSCLSTTTFEAFLSISKWVSSASGVRTLLSSLTGVWMISSLVDPAPQPSVSSTYCNSVCSLPPSGIEMVQECTSILLFIFFCMAPKNVKLKNNLDIETVVEQLFVLRRRRHKLLKKNFVLAAMNRIVREKFNKSKAEHAFLPCYYLKS